MPDASTLEKQEVLARAVIDPEGIIEGGDAAHLEAAKEIRKQTTADNPRSATEYLANRRELDKSKRIERSERIGIKVNDEGKMDRTGDARATARFDESETKGKMIEELLEGTTDLTEARKSVRSVIGTMPEAEKILSGVPEPTQDQIIDGWLKDPRFIAALRKNYDSLPTDGPTLKEVFEAETKYKTAKAKKEERAKERDKVKGELDTVSLKAAKFSEEEHGDSYDEIKRLEGEDGKDEQKRTRKITELDNRRRQLEVRIKLADDKLSRQKLENPADPKIQNAQDLINADKEELQQVIEDYDTENSVQQGLIRLRKEKLQAESKRKELEDRHSALVTEVDKLDDEMRIEQIELNIVTDDKERADIRYVESLKSAMLTSLRDLAEVRTVAEEASRAKLLAKQIEKEGDKFAKILKKNQQNRWMRIENKKPKPNDDTIDSDYSDLLTGGLDVATAGVLGIGFNKDGTINTGSLPDGHPLKGLTDEKFKELVASEGKGIALEIIRHRLQTKGISKKEAETIVSSDWGQTAIQDAVDKNKQAKAALEAAAKASGHKGSLIEFIKRKPYVLAALLPLVLYLLYGGGLGLVVGGVALGAKAAASNINTGL